MLFYPLKKCIRFLTDLAFLDLQLQKYLGERLSLTHKSYRLCAKKLYRSILSKNYNRTKNTASFFATFTVKKQLILKIAWSKSNFLSLRHLSQREEKKLILIPQTKKLAQSLRHRYNKVAHRFVDVVVVVVVFIVAIIVVEAVVIAVVVFKLFIAVAVIVIYCCLLLLLYGCCYCC